MISPRQIAEDHSNAVSNVADNAISANIEAFNTSIQTAKESAKELSKMSGNTMKTLQQVSKHPNRVFVRSLVEQQ
jgi:hypothetical protein